MYHLNEAMISRRTVLKGLGTAIALPWLEAMQPIMTLGQTARQPAAPLRMAFVYLPNGMHMQDWTPEQVGADFALPWILEPLQPFKRELLVLSGLTLDKARANGDGGGDHARAMSAFLTGRQPRKTHGADIRAGISVDQFAAERVGHATRFPSLELGCERGAQAGNCDSGYSCAYSSSISWRSENMPNGKEVDPRLVFDRLFGNDNRPEQTAARARRDMYNQSILDFVREDANDLSRRLGMTDRRKLDEYLTSIREIERRIEHARRMANQPPPQPNMPRPSGIPRNDFQEHVRLMYDLMAVAFQGDLTRIITFAVANDGSNRPYPFLTTSRNERVSEGHHDLSHHQNDPRKHEKIRTINRFHIEQLAYFLGRLRAVQEGAGTLLDHVMIVYGSGIADGNRHNHEDLPILLAGRANGTLRTGRHLRFARETPLMNLYLNMLDRMGCPTDSFGDSTGRLQGLDR